MILLNKMNLKKGGERDDVISSTPPELEVVHFKRSVNASCGGSAERVARERASRDLAGAA